MMRIRKAGKNGKKSENELNSVENGLLKAALTRHHGLMGGSATTTQPLSGRLKGPVHKRSLGLGLNLERLSFRRG